MLIEKVYHYTNTPFFTHTIPLRPLIFYFNNNIIKINYIIIGGEDPVCEGVCLKRCNGVLVYFVNKC